MKNRGELLNFGAWSLSSIVTIIAIVGWGSFYHWHLSHISAYQFFPLLGLIAFSLMWSHYIVSVARQMIKLPITVVSRYFNITSVVVLIAICLHPGLLIYLLLRDGYGLPPGSYERYVGPGLGWVTLLGTASLLIFLAYEFRRKYGKRDWWHYMQYAVDAAMLAILYHSLRLGTQLQTGWLKFVWHLYGVTLVACLVYQYSKKIKARSLASN